MRTVIVLFLLLIPWGCWASYDGDIRCLRIDQVEFREAHDRIRISGEPDKKSSIAVMIEIDCESGAVVVPKSSEEAVDRLDLALPSDYKIAISKGELMTSYAYGNYYASADTDIFLYFSRLWNLEYGTAACERVESLKRVDYSCYFSLIDQLRGRYQAMIGFMPRGLVEEIE